MYNEVTQYLGMFIRSISSVFRSSSPFHSILWFVRSVIRIRIRLFVLPSCFCTCSCSSAANFWIRYEFADLRFGPISISLPVYSHSYNVCGTLESLSFSVFVRLCVGVGFLRVQKSYQFDVKYGLTIQSSAYIGNESCIGTFYQFLFGCVSFVLFAMLLPPP